MKRKWKLYIIVIMVIALGIFCRWKFIGRTYEIVFTPQIGQREEIKKIKIATYNVKILDKGNALDLLVKELKKENIDIICFQEIDKNAYRSKNMDMIQEIADKSGYGHYYFYESMWLGKGSYGLGIVSRYPIERVSSKELVNDFFEEPRILAKADIRVGEKVLHVYNTHVSYRNRDMRKQQIEEISNVLKGEKDTILMGDMNAFYEGDLYDLEGYHSVNNKEHTYLTFRNIAPTDNIFYANHMTVSDIKLTPSSFSDHNLLSCYLYL